MSLGQKIKKARLDANLTQKDLADALNVTFQTVSKWENGTTEPDLATLRLLSKLLGCTLEYLISEDEEIPNPIPVEEVKPILPPIPEKRQIGTCTDCHAPIMEGDIYHNVERKSPGGIKETVMICHPCFQRREEEIERLAHEAELSISPKPKASGRSHRITDRKDKKPLIWSIVLGAIALVVALIVCIARYNSVGIGWTIGAPLLLGYATTATIYCIFTASFVSDIFLGVASWTIRFPGLIFSWSLDGILWLIGMKILFFVVSVMISIGTFLLAVALAAVFSVFTFIPLLIYNKTHY
ncbi:MAG: helix-turn-helix transcriptional regulator [Candidatus Enteromonas sp.]|nr:helix-turn-helix transcriptional regulator [Candidatus Enteromonas sp.]